MSSGANDGCGDGGERAEAALRPVIRGDCRYLPRPCPWVGCKWHLLFDVLGRRKSRELAPELAAEFMFNGMRRTCALDVADDGGGSFEDVGEVLQVSRQRVQQIEEGSIRAVHQNQPDMVARLQDFRAFDAKPWESNRLEGAKMNKEKAWVAEL